ncbi:MAG: hypothetical protein CM1200mP12_06060 [Gammaproteobacteria bacterium]|nr:MAG: hypothetical protein CM1200mP12_06060 [Gammaproteobacteria bacterium]
MFRSDEPELIFGNDADDMRSPGRGIDPRAMTNDLTNDPITYAVQRIELVNQTFKELPTKLEGKVMGRVCKCLSKNYLGNPVDLYKQYHVS